MSFSDEQHFFHNQKRKVFEIPEHLEIKAAGPTQKLFLSILPISPLSSDMYKKVNATEIN